MKNKLMLGVYSGAVSIILLLIPKSLYIPTEAMWLNSKGSVLETFTGLFLSPGMVIMMVTSFAVMIAMSVAFIALAKKYDNAILAKAIFAYIVSFPILMPVMTASIVIVGTSLIFGTSPLFAPAAIVLLISLSIYLVIIVMGVKGLNRLSPHIPHAKYLYWLVLTSAILQNIPFVQNTLLIIVTLMVIKIFYKEAQSVSMTPSSSSI